MVDVTYATDDDLERWNRRVERSRQGTPFHYREALTVFATHSGTSVHPLVAYKGQEIVGLFPVYELSKGLVTTVFSPPPRLKISYGGPLLLNFDKLKQRRTEKRHRRLVGNAVEFIDAELSPRYVQIRTSPHYDDVRPFAWRQFESEPRYTYVVDLDDGDAAALLDSFSSDARRNIRQSEGDCAIEEGGRDAIRNIIAQLQDRHEEQGLSFPITSEFVVALWRQLPEGTVRPYVCTVDGTFAGGMITLETDRAIYAWQGGAKTDSDLPVADLLGWHIMCDAMDRGIRYYDLVGANNERISEFKAKFAPRLETFYVVKRSTLPMDILASCYDKLK